MLARVARTRFYVPPNTLAAVLRAADPVVTSTPEGLRFESFSVCCGVYARLDVDAAALDATHVAPGVTNVDVNPPLRQALAGLRASEPLHLNVGSDALRVSTGAGEIVEEKVPLPTRWLKGFAETQMLSAGMACRHALTGAALRQFVQALPRSSSTKTVMWATQAARSLRLATQATPGAVCVAGPERLRVLEPLLRYATALRAYGAETAAGALPQASAWVLELPGARVTLGLSPEKARGFSGEGAVLHLVAGGDANEDAAFVSTLLAFEPRIDIAQLAARALLPDAQIASALGVLASSGQVGFDLAAGAYFHRPLPVQAGLLDTLHPRLAEARKLVAGGGVRREGEGSTRCNRRSSATGSRWAPSPRKTVAPAPGTPSIKARAGRASTRWRCACFLIPSMRLEPEHDLEPDRTPRGAARGRRRRRRGGYRAVRARAGRRGRGRARRAGQGLAAIAPVQRGGADAPGLLCAGRIGQTQARGGDAGAGGHGTQARIWRAPRRDDAGRDRGGSRTGRNVARRVRRAVSGAVLVG